MGTGRDVESPPRSPTSPKLEVSVGSMALQLQQFLDDWHYRVLHSSLGKKWPRQRVLNCVLDILAFNGVPITEDQRTEFYGLEESVMVEKLAIIMPQPQREGFEHLSLQLKMVVTMATRCRQALEDGDEQTITDIMNTSDETGLGQQVLKAAIVSASKEVAEIQMCQETWIANMDQRLERLLKASEYAEKANQQLLAVEAQLDAFGVNSKGKSKKVLMGMAESNNKSLVHSVYSAWLGLTLKVKAEHAIRSKFEKQLQDAQDELMELKKKRFGNIRGAVARSQEDGDLGLFRFVMKVWLEEVHDRKKEGDTAAEIKKLEEKLKAAKESQSAASKKVLAKMAGDRENTLVNLIFQTWAKAITMLKEDKEFEAAVAKSEALLKEHAAKQKDQAASVLTRMTNATESGLLAAVIRGWKECLEENKKAAEMDYMLGGAGGRLKGLQGRQLGNARGVQTRVNEQMNMNLLLRCFGVWQLEAKAAAVQRYYTGKIEGKRRQLNSVQTLFKSFARQLEEGLGNLDGDSSGRTGYRSRREMKGTMGPAIPAASLVGPSGGLKESSSLPDINLRPHVA